jgi:hypothetical protein
MTVEPSDLRMIAAFEAEFARLCPSGQHQEPFRTCR